MDALRNILLAASSQDPRGLTNAEQQLKSLEIQPGFHSALLATASDRTVDNGARLQAILYLKNGVDKYWRKNAPNAIGDGEKIEIRRLMLQSFGSEPVYQIALQAAVSIGKIARYDVPKDWPELLPALVQAVQVVDPLIQQRALLVLHHVIKALASKRLAADRRVFHDMIEELLPYVLPIWQLYHGQVVQIFSNGSQTFADESQVTPIIEKSVLVLKVIRKAVVHGLRKPCENEHAMLLLKTLIEQIRIVLPYRNLKACWKEIFEKYSVLQMKLVADLLENHPFSFLPVMKEALNVICRLCFTPEGEGLLFQRFIIMCFNIIKQVLLCPEYKLAKQADQQDEEIRNSPSFQGHTIKTEFFEPTTVTEVAKCLISQYLLLSKDDLELWDADPEQYVCEDGGDSWRYSYRPCCETLFLTVFHENRTHLAPMMVEMVRNTAGPVNSQDLRALLNKDAVYNAVGLAAFDLYDEIDFDRWLVNGIEQELLIKDSNYRIVRRRAAWLVGQWSGVKLSPELRPKLYQILVPLLEKDEDLVVRLAAAKALKVVIDDFEFTSEELKPYLSSAFGQLFDLLKEVEECDTKLSILNVLSYVIERVGVGIRSMCEELAHYLPSLWASSEAHDMLRCSILGTLVSIVQGLGSITESLAPFLHDVIYMSTHLNNSCSVYLLEDGLELWLVALQNSKHLLPQWMQLASNIPPILELSSENLRTMIYIVQAYIVLAPNEFVATCGASVMKPLDVQYGDLQDEGVLMILRLVDLTLKIGPPQSSRIFQPLILRSMQAVYEGQAYPMLMSVHLSIVSRMILSYKPEFQEFLNALATNNGNQSDDIAAQILDVWMDKMPCVTQPERRKLLSLALTSLMNSGSPVVLQRIYGLLLNVTETLNDIMRQDEDNSAMIDSLLINHNNDLTLSSEDLDYETEHEHRKRELNKGDSVYTVDLREFFQSQIQNLYGQVGQTRYTEIMSNVDVETMKNMQEFITV